MTWLFDQPENCAVITTADVLERREPITRVTHDEDDHGWQFIGPSGPVEHRAKIVSLGSIVKLDPTVAELGDMPPGWRATRATRDSRWVREPAPP